MCSIFVLICIIVSDLAGQCSNYDGNQNDCDGDTSILTPSYLFFLSFLPIISFFSFYTRLLQSFWFGKWRFMFWKKSMQYLWHDRHNGHRDMWLYWIRFFSFLFLFFLFLFVYFNFLILCEYKKHNIIN
jgi:hypothetical protein